MYSTHESVNKIPFDNNQSHLSVGRRRIQQELTETCPFKTDPPLRLNLLSKKYLYDLFHILLLPLQTWNFLIYGVCNGIHNLLVYSC